MSTERHGYLARYEELQREARQLLNEQVDEVKSVGEDRHERPSQDGTSGRGDHRCG